jgi:predicted phosphodiesterase
VLLVVTADTHVPARARDLPVFGHSHIPWDTRGPAGPRLLNPGSPTDRRRQPYATFVTARVRHARLDDVVWHRLPPRPARGRSPGH